MSFGGDPTKTPVPKLTSTQPRDNPGVSGPSSGGTGLSATVSSGNFPATGPTQMGATPTPSNSYNEIASSQAKAAKARGRLATIYTSNYGIAPNPQLSLARKMLTA